MLSTDKQTIKQTDRQTDKLTNATKNITSFAKEVTSMNIFFRFNHDVIETDESHVHHISTQTDEHLHDYVTGNIR